MGISSILTNASLISFLFAFFILVIFSHFLIFKTTGIMIIVNIIFILIAIILGYLFLKHYESIDTALFEVFIPNYESYGKPVIIISILGGSICGSAIMYNTFIGNHLMAKTIIIYYAPVLLCCIIAIGIFQSIFKMKAIGLFLGKSFFMCTACVIGFVIGGLGSIVIICLIVLYILALFIGGALKPKSDVKKYNEEADDLNNELYRARYDGLSKLEKEDLEYRVNEHNDREP